MNLQNLSKYGHPHFTNPPSPPVCSCLHPADPPPPLMWTSLWMAPNRFRNFLYDVYVQHNFLYTQTLMKKKKCIKENNIFLKQNFFVTVLTYFVQPLPVIQQTGIIYQRKGQFTYCSEFYKQNVRVNVTR